LSHCSCYLSPHMVVYKHTCSHQLHLSLSLSPSSVQLKSNTSPLHYSRHSPYNSPPPTTPSLPPISRIQHQHTMNVGVEKDRDGENLPKIILTHNRVVKRDRERVVWGEYMSVKIKWCREDKQGCFPTPVHDFHKRTRKQEKLLDGFAFGVRLHS